MPYPKNVIKAVYRPSIGQYRGNPFIEALPPILEALQVRDALKGSVELHPSDNHESGVVRGHLIAQLMNNFFQPITRHIQLEQKLSIMIREGYVGRNLADGHLAAHLQNGYERTMTGDTTAVRYESVRSTARSMSFIGCSGSGKTTTLNRILSTYPQVIYHEGYNFTQITYLKIDCPHDGSLKNLCLHFFRAIDQVLGTNYEDKYALKRHGIATLLNLMGQIANFHAIGLLIIDEIQHLSVKNSGGADKMLNFFVTLVNVVGLPVVMVGTPKARFIFEDDFRSARRGVGLGSLFWEQMKQEPNILVPDTNRIIKSEWMAFTDALWKYQWLKKADITLTDDIRSCWYDLSQGILDIVVKLFVLAQIRAIASGLERITISLLKQTYEEELKPIHPMIQALKSNDADRIARYSDLIIPDIDKRLLQLQAKVESQFLEDDELSEYHGHEESIRLHRLLLELGYQSQLLVPIIKQAFSDYPDISMKTVMPIVLEWLNNNFNDVAQITKSKNDSTKIRTKTSKTKPEQWHTLDSEDLRFQFSQKDSEKSFYDHLKAESNLIFDTEHWLKQVS